MKRIIAMVLMTLALIATLTMTSFAATTINKAPANAPTAVKNVEKAWNKAPIDGFALIYDSTNKRILLANDTADGALIYTAALGAYGNKTKQSAIDMLESVEDTIDTMYVALKGSGWDCGFALRSNTSNELLLNYSPTVGWF